MPGPQLGCRRPLLSKREKKRLILIADSFIWQLHKWPLKGDFGDGTGLLPYGIIAHRKTLPRQRLARSCRWPIDVLVLPCRELCSGMKSWPTCTPVALVAKLHL